eukprot:14859542-Ditylum_brightwellii.AAC.1
MFRLRGIMTMRDVWYVIYHQNSWIYTKVHHVVDRERSTDICLWLVDDRAPNHVSHGSNNIYNTIRQSAIELETKKVP